MTNDFDSCMTLLLYITVNINTHPQSTVFFLNLQLLLLICFHKVKVFFKLPVLLNDLYYGKPITCSITLTQNHLIYDFITNLYLSIPHKNVWPQ